MSGVVRELSWLEKVRQLPPAEQDAVGWGILHAFEDDDAWAARFAQPSLKLRELLREAREEHARGETQPLDDLLGCVRPALVSAV